jgi:excisionase family DNA binding protein
MRNSKPARVTRPERRNQGRKSKAKAPLNGLHPLLGIRDVIEYTGQSDSTIRRAVRHGYLRGYRMPGGWRFRLNDVDSWIDSFAVEPDAVLDTPLPRLSNILAGASA